MKIDKQDLNRIFASNDVMEIRAFLSNSLLWNSEDISTIKECVENLSDKEGVLVSHNGEIFSKDKNKYTRDYLNDVNTELMFNFSKERYLHALEVANYLEVLETRNKENNNITSIKIMDKNSKSRINKSNTNNDVNKKKTKNQSSLVVKVLIAVIAVVIVLILINIMK